MADTNIPPQFVVDLFNFLGEHLQPITQLYFTPVPRVEPSLLDEFRQYLDNIDEESWNQALDWIRLGVITVTGLTFMIVLLGKGIQYRSNARLIHDNTLSNHGIHSNTPSNHVIHSNTHSNHTDTCNMKILTPSQVPQQCTSTASIQFEPEESALTDLRKRISFTSCKPSNQTDTCNMKILTASEVSELRRNTPLVTCDYVYEDSEETELSKKLSFTSYKPSNHADTYLARVTSAPSAKQHRITGSMQCDSEDSEETELSKRLSFTSYKQHRITGSMQCDSEDSEETGVSKRLSFTSYKPSNHADTYLARITAAPVAKQQRITGSIQYDSEESKETRWSNIRDRISLSCKPSKEMLCSPLDELVTVTELPKRVSFSSCMPTKQMLYSPLDDNEWPDTPELSEDEDFFDTTRSSSTVSMEIDPLDRDSQLYPVDRLKDVSEIKSIHQQLKELKSEVIKVKELSRDAMLNSKYCIDVLNSKERAAPDHTVDQNHKMALRQTAEHHTDETKGAAPDHTVDQNHKMALRQASEHPTDETKGAAPDHTVDQNHKMALRQTAEHPTDETKGAAPVSAQNDKGNSEGAATPVKPADAKSSSLSKIPIMKNVRSSGYGLRSVQKRSSLNGSAEHTAATPLWDPSIKVKAKHQGQP